MPVDRRSFLTSLAALAVGGGLTARETQATDPIKGQAPTSTPWDDDPWPLSDIQELEILAHDFLAGRTPPAVDTDIRAAIRRYNERFEDWLINGD